MKKELGIFVLLIVLCIIVSVINPNFLLTINLQNLARQIGAGQRATMIFQSRRLHACLDGALSIQHDPDRIEKYWNSVVAAWYPDGKDDPLLTLLCFDGVNAQLWITETGPLKFMWEIAKANATGRTPDIGDRADISLH